jgi:hypothetical protein
MGQILQEAYLASEEDKAKQKRAISALQGLAKRWPKSLWLFAANGRLNVMACDDNGNRALTPGGSMDPAASIATIDIPCDGGDW